MTFGARLTKKLDLFGALPLVILAKIIEAGQPKMDVAQIYQWGTLWKKLATRIERKGNPPLPPHHWVRNK